MNTTIDRAVPIDRFHGVPRSFANERECSTLAHRGTPKGADLHTPDEIYLQSWNMVSSVTLHITPAQLIDLANTMLTDDERACIVRGGAS